MVSSARSSCVWLPLALAACGGAEPARAPDSPSEASAAAAPEPASEPASVEEPTPDEGAEAASPDGVEEAPARKQREVLYKVTPEGLVVDVDGVRFRPKAEPTKQPNGAYGIRVTVEAESRDDDTHVLVSPENGPLAFAIRIYDKSGNEQARHGDERNGDEQQFIMPGGPLTFSREWPSGSVKGPLLWGQKARLEVGLWGLGRANEQTRPMQRFFVVEMVGGAKPQAVISPPVMSK